MGVSPHLVARRTGLGRINESRISEGCDGEAGVEGGLFEAEGFFEFLGEVELDGVTFEVFAHPGVGDFGFGGEYGTAVVGELCDIRHGFRVTSLGCGIRISYCLGWFTWRLSRRCF